MPVTIGLVIASGTVMARAADAGWQAAALTIAAAVVMLKTRLNPLWTISQAEPSVASAYSE